MKISAFSRLPVILIVTFLPVFFLPATVRGQAWYNFNWFKNLIRRYSVHALIVFLWLLPTEAQAQTVADVIINTSATTGGTWSASAPWIFTPNAGVTSANILNTDLQAKLGASAVGYDVTINTTNDSGSSAGNGDITVSATITLPAIDTRVTTYNLTFNATRNITINSAIDLSGRIGSCCSIGAGDNLTLNASTGSVSIPAAITTTGGANTGGSGGPGYNGGNVSITAGTTVNVSANITTSGGTAAKGAGGNGGTISITGPSGVTLPQDLTANGGNGTTGSGGGPGGNGGNIAINDGAVTVTTGGGANDGQTGGLIASSGGTGTSSGSGGSFTKSGTGILVLSQLNTYTGTTSIDAGYLRASTNNVTASANGPFGNNASGLNLNGGAIRSNVATFSRPITVTATNSGLDAYGSARTISSSITNATVSSSFNLNVGGTTVSNAEGQDLTLSGVISNSSGTLSLTKIGTSLLTLSAANTFSGGTILSAGQLNINHATAAGSGAFTISGGIIDNTTAGSITLSNNNTQNWNGDFTFTGTQSLNMGTGAVTLSASRQITVSANTLTVAGTINQSSLNLTKAGSGTLNFNSQTISLNNLTISAGTLNSNNLNINIGGNLTNNSTFTPGSGTVTFNGSSAQIVSGSQTLNVYNLVTNNSSGITLNTNLSVSGAHTFSAGHITTSATPNYLIYAAGSSYSGNADTRHVNGWVKKIGSTNFIFPVGNATYERVVGISNLSASSEINCKYFTTTNNTINLFSPLAMVKANEYWQMDKISGGTAQVTLNWDHTKVAMDNVLIIDILSSQYTAGNWTSTGGTASGNITTTGTITSNALSTFGSHTFGYTSFPVPLKLLSFTAIRASGTSFLKWVTENEQNVGHFDVQRSYNGISFATIGNVAASNSGSREIYNFKDHSSLNGIAYYRIKNVDIDGKLSYSRIAVVSENDLKSASFVVLNPARSVITVLNKSGENGPFDYFIYNSGGQLITKGIANMGINGGSALPIPAHTPAGNYILEIRNDKLQFRQKIFVEK